MHLSYNFTQAEKEFLKQVVDDSSIQEMLNLEGKSVFSIDEAEYLAICAMKFASGILRHPAIRGTLNERWFYEDQNTTT